MCNIVTKFYLYSIVYIYLINSRLDVTTSVRHHFRMKLYHNTLQRGKNSTRSPAQHVQPVTELCLYNRFLINRSCRLDSRLSVFVIIFVHILYQPADRVVCILSNRLLKRMVLYPGMYYGGEKRGKFPKIWLVHCDQHKTNW